MADERMNRDFTEIIQALEELGFEVLEIRRNLDVRAKYGLGRIEISVDANREED